MFVVSCMLCMKHCHGRFQNTHRTAESQLIHAAIYKLVLHQLNKSDSSYMWI